eukprot:6206982-Pleurochrysis_carterae.AAC.2
MQSNFRRSFKVSSQGVDLPDQIAEDERRDDPMHDHRQCLFATVRMKARLSTETETIWCFSATIGWHGPARACQQTSHTGSVCFPAFTELWKIGACDARVTLHACNLARQSSARRALNSTHVCRHMHTRTAASRSKPRAPRRMRASDVACTSPSRRTTPCAQRTVYSARRMAWPLCVEPACARARVPAPASWSASRRRSRSRRKGRRTESKSAAARATRALRQLKMAMRRWAAAHVLRGARRLTLQS